MTTRAKTPAPVSDALPAAEPVSENIVEAVAQSFGEPAPEPVTVEPFTAPAQADAAVRSAAESATKQASAGVETLMAGTQKAMADRFDKLSRRLEGMTAFNQENLDALVKSSEIAAKAAEGIGSEVSAYSRKAFEDSVAAAQNLAAAKTLAELLQKQTAFAQTAFEGFVQQSTKMNEILVAATKEITAPLGQRATAAAERMKSLAL